MDRGLRKTDGKFEYRLKNDGGGNQTEFYRDVIGNSLDFAEGDAENTAEDFVGDPTISNGIYTHTSSASAYVIKHLDLESNYVSLQTITTFEIKIKTNSIASNNVVTYIRSNENGRYRFKTYSIGLTWTTIQWNFHDVYDTDLNFVEDGNLYGWNVALSSAGITADIEYIKLIGDLDFATHIDAEVEDTWDWEDSDEYFYDEISNISDFDDGTTENWTAAIDSTVIQTDGFLKITDSNSISDIERSNLAIVSSTYKWFTFEFNSSQSLTSILIYDGVPGTGNVVCTDSTGWSSATWYLLSCNLDLDGDWSGTEAALGIRFFASAAATIFLNMTFLYDVELGDLEGRTGIVNQYVNPNGYFTGTLVAGDFDILSTTPNFVMDASLFNYLTVRAKSSENVYLSFYGVDQDDVFTLIELQTFTLTNSWTVYTLDLSTDVQWNSATYWKRIDFVLEDSDGTNEGDEQVFLDYVLLLGHWQVTDAVIGLMNPSTKAPLVNITTHFFAQPDDPYYLSNLTSWRYEIELLDESGEVAYSYLSDNITTLGEGWIRGKVQYDVLQSQFIISLSADNLTRIFRILFPEGFTEQTGRPPALFNLGKNPAMFVSTYTQPVSWQSLTIDFIEAPFQERQWVQTSSPSDADWVEDSPFFAQIQDDADTQTSTYQMVVPSLDSVSGIMKVNTTDNAEYANSCGGGCASELIIKFTINSVDFDDGDLHNVVDISVAILAESFYETQIIIEENEAITEITRYTSSGSTPFYSPEARFTISLTENRESIVTRVRANPASEQANNTELISEYRFIDDFSDFSQEFVLGISYEVSIFGTNPSSDDSLEASLILDDFSFTKEDIFKDIGNFIGDVGDSVGDLGKGPLDFIGNIFREIGNFLAVAFKGAIDTLQTALTGAFTTLQSVLDASLGLVEIAVDAVTSAVVSIGSDIVGAVGSIAQAVIDGLVGLLQDIIDAVADIAGGIWDALVAVITDIVDAIGGALSLIIDYLIGVGSYLLDSFLNLLPFGIGAFIRGFNNLNIGTVFTQIFNIITFILTFSLLWLMLFLGFYMFVFPIIQNPDNPGAVFGDMFRNMFSLHGTDFQTLFGNITVPIRINAIMVWLFLVTILGYLGWILPFNLF